MERRSKCDQLEFQVKAAVQLSPTKQVLMLDESAARSTILATERPDFLEIERHTTIIKSEKFLISRAGGIPVAQASSNPDENINSVPEWPNSQESGTMEIVSEGSLETKMDISSQESIMDYSSQESQDINLRTWKTESQELRENTLTNGSASLPPSSVHPDGEEKENELKFLPENSQQALSGKDVSDQPQIKKDHDECSGVEQRDTKHAQKRSLEEEEEDLSARAELVAAREEACDLREKVLRMQEEYKRRRML